MIGLRSALKGIERVQVDGEILQEDLKDAWEVLAEAIQTVMRKGGLPNPYERMKSLTRGARITREEMREFIRGLDLPQKDKERLLSCAPEDYIGRASELVRNIMTTEKKG